MSLECVHGRLARSCETCELIADLDLATKAAEMHRQNFERANAEVGRLMDRDQLAALLDEALPLIYKVTRYAECPSRQRAMDLLAGWLERAKAVRQ